MDTDAKASLTGVQTVDDEAGRAVDVDGRTVDNDGQMFRDATESENKLW